jgi:hypothetical protein
MGKWLSNMGLKINVNEVYTFIHGTKVYMESEVALVG